MKLIDLEKIEVKHEDYSLNINNLIEGLKRNPDDYIIFNSRDKDDCQNILVSKDGIDVLEIETSSNYFIVTDPKSAVDYSIEWQSDKEIEMDGYKVSEFAIFESIDKKKDSKIDLRDNEINVNFEIAIIKDIDGEQKVKCTGGSYSAIDEISGEKFHVTFSMDDELDDEYDDEIENADDDDDEFEVEEEYSDDDDEIEDDDDEELVFVIFKENGEVNSNDFSDKDYKEIKEGIFQMYTQAIQDFQVRVVEIQALRNAISKRIKRCRDNMLNKGNQEVDKETR